MTNKFIDSAIDVTGIAFLDIFWQKVIAGAGSQSDDIILTGVFIFYINKH